MERRLKGIPEELHELTEILLLCIDKDIEIDNYLTNHPNDSNVHWRRDILGRLQDVVIILEDNEVIIPAEGRKSRWQLKYPLNNCEEVEVEDEYIESVRKWFSKSYSNASTRSSSVRVLSPIIEELLSQNPDLKEDLPHVCKYRVDIAEEPTHVPKLIHFLNVTRNKEWIDRDVLVYWEEWKEVGESTYGTNL